MQKKIVHVDVIDKYVEGSGYQENLLSKKYADLGFKSYLVASQFTIIKGQPTLLPVSRYFNKDGVEITILPKRRYSCRGRLGWFFKKTRGLYCYLKEISPDIIFLHGLAEWDIYDVIQYVKKNPKVLLIVDNHRDYFNAPVNWKTKLLNIRFYFMHQELNKYAKIFWGVTPWRVKYLTDVYGMPKNKCDLLVMGADESLINEGNKNIIRQETRDKYGIPQNSFVVVSGGRLEKRKRMDILAEAISRFSTEQNVYLLMFGDPVRGYEDLEKYRNIQNIKMIGAVESNSVYDLFLSSDLAVFPATHSVLWEQSVACGLPGIYKFWDGMKHINVNGNAILMDDINPDSLYKIIRELIGSEEYELMRSKAQEAKCNFYYKNIALRAIGNEAVKF